MAFQKNDPPNWSRQVCSIYHFHSLKCKIFFSILSAIPQVCVWETTQNGVTRTLYNHGSRLDATNFDDVLCIITRYNSHQHGVQCLTVDMESLRIAEAGNCIQLSRIFTSS
jgi:hypothetical protein